ncbi:MAG: MarR family transcriptional regulator [Candidatus Micrarchaeota archaeon]|nr:MarR family transcriptional regulator [Candidatus Micrarchaeota archaeon]MDE1849714.1 MarR family transcriptional regulator [Candidatus Micrarchaeota archaeon]
MAGKSGGPSIIRVLFLIGGALIFLSGLLAILGFPIGFTFTDGHMMVLVLPNISIYHGIVETASGIVVLLMTMRMRMTDPASVQNHSIVALVVSIASLIGGGGFLAGFVLVFIGGVLGISYGYSAASRHLYIKPVEAGKRMAQEKPASAPDRKALRLMRPEERKLYELIEQADGAIFQSELVERSKLTKVKVTRILDRLEGRGLVERRRRGMTNMVLLKSSEVASQRP